MSLLPVPRLQPVRTEGRVAIFMDQGRLTPFAKLRRKGGDRYRSPDSAVQP